jgi:hypothetical protein
MHCELVVGPSRLRARPRSLELLAARGRAKKAPPQRLERWLQEAFG